MARRRRQRILVKVVWRKNPDPKEILRALIQVVEREERLKAERRAAQAEAHEAPEVT